MNFQRQDDGHYDQATVRHRTAVQRDCCDGTGVVAQAICDMGFEMGKDNTHLAFRQLLV